MTLCGTGSTRCDERPKGYGIGASGCMIEQWKHYANIQAIANYTKR